jgi:hypothetical protein
VGLACIEPVEYGSELSYLALCLTACAGVAVLGARRPGVGAWNFVVAGLLAVLLRPGLERLLGMRPHATHLIILGMALAVPLANYLPTRLAPAVLALGTGCALEIADLAWWHRNLVGWQVPVPLRWTGRALLAASPWLALAALRLAPAPATEFDAVWRNFRDRFGFLWGQRTREQFNRAAQNAGWAVRLGWSGLQALPGARFPDPGAALATLRATLQRFGPPSAINSQRRDPQ